MREWKLWRLSLFVGQRFRPRQHPVYFILQHHAALAQFGHMKIIAGLHIRFRLVNAMIDLFIFAGNAMEVTVRIPEVAHLNQMVRKLLSQMVWGARHAVSSVLGLHDHARPATLLRA